MDLRDNHIAVLDQVFQNSVLITGIEVPPEAEHVADIETPQYVFKIFVAEHGIVYRNETTGNGYFVSYEDIMRMLLIRYTYRRNTTH